MNKPLTSFVIRKSNSNNNELHTYLIECLKLNTTQHTHTDTGNLAFPLLVMLRKSTDSHLSVVGMQNGSHNERQFGRLFQH